MGYYEIQIECDDSLKEPLIGLLTDSLGVLDNHKGLTFYFADVKGIGSILESMRNAETALIESGLANGLDFNHTYLAERDWNESWKKRFIPIDVAGFLTILPPWENKREGSLNIIIDPGMAFGTGHHETTQRCLELIIEYSRHIDRGSFLDLGTGTGILAIAASLIGFREVTAFDNDPLAIDAAQRNVSENGLSNITLLLADVSEARGAYDMVVANLLFNVLLENSANISRLLKPQGIGIISGLIQGQDELLIPHFIVKDLRLLTKVDYMNWTTLVVMRDWPL